MNPYTVFKIEGGDGVYVKTENGKIQVLKDDSKRGYEVTDGSISEKAFFDVEKVSKVLSDITIRFDDLEQGQKFKQSEHGYVYMKISSDIGGFVCLDDGEHFGPGYFGTITVEDLINE